MLPWMYGYDRLNYAKYMAVCWVEMSTPDDYHPEAHRFLSEGYFGVQQKANHGISMILVDQANPEKEYKSKGGIIRYSVYQGFIQRLPKIPHERAAIVDACRNMVGI